MAPHGTALLMSVLLRPPPEVAHFAVMAVGCAAAAACASAGFTPGLKWPNDLVSDGRKLGGILAEVAASTSGNVAAVVVGLGLNIHRPPDRPDELAAVAVDLEDLVGAPVERDALLSLILGELTPRYAELLQSGPLELLTEYRSRCVTIGGEVRVEQPGDVVVAGTAVGVDDSGALLVSSGPDLVVRVEVGDVVHVRRV